MSLLERLGKKKDDKEKNVEGQENDATRAKTGGLGARLTVSHVPTDTEQDRNVVSSPEAIAGDKPVEEQSSIDMAEATPIAPIALDQNNTSAGGNGLSGLFGRSSGKGSGLAARLVGSKTIERDERVNKNSIINEEKESLARTDGGPGARLLRQESELNRLSDHRVISEKAADSAEKKFSAEEMRLEETKAGTPIGGLGAKLGMASRSGLGERLGKVQEKGNEVSETINKPSLMAKKAGLHPAAEQDQYQGLKIEVHRQIVEELSAEQRQIIANPNSDRLELQRIVVELCNRVIDGGDNPMAISRADRANIVNDLIDEVLGLGPIEPLLKDETVSEVMINGPQMVYVERKGKLTLTNVQFQDETHLMNIIERIVAPLGRRIDESSPLVDARLADGSRVNVIIPPLALNGACVTIRKFAKDPLTINNLIGFGSLTEDMAALIKACVLGRLNIVVSGGTGSGKTTTLNVLSSFIPEDERIVTIEDAAELQLRQDHVVTLESRPANVEGTGQVSIRDLVRNSLRMRPDRIVVGEVRSGEALDMLQAMNTGHDGSLTTAHANTPRDVISRLETMVLMAGMELPVRAIREQIASAVDLIIQQSRLRDGSRKITHITEVQGMEGDVIVLQDLFTFEQAGLDENGKLQGSFCTSGIRPKFLEKLETNGIKVDYSMFQKNMGWDV